MVRKQQYVQESVAAARTDYSTVSKPTLEHSKEYQSSKSKKKPSPWICHHCKERGHIRPFCFKLHGYSKQSQQKPPKKEWIPRCVNDGLIAHTSLRASSKKDWYVDSGCSRHMTGVDKYLEDVRPYASNYVNFCDDAKGKIIGIGNLIKDGLPRLDNMVLVKGLTVNLISISQLCDQGMEVNFSKPECHITDKKGEGSYERYQIYRQLLLVGTSRGITLIHLSCE